MAKVNITVAIDDYKLDALEYALKKENATVQKSMERALAELYEKTVPPEIRDYIENARAPTKTKPKKPKPKPPKNDGI